MEFRLRASGSCPVSPLGVLILGIVFPHAQCPAATKVNRLSSVPAQAACLGSDGTDMIGALRKMAWLA